MTDFHLTDHHNFVLRHGETVQWRKSYLCPCSTVADPARARTDCFLCFGSGLTYGTAADMTGMVTAITRQKELLEAGIAEPGDLVLSVSPLEQRILSNGDMIQLTSFPGQPFQGELVKRARSGLVDKLAYAPVTISRCFTADQSSDTVREFVNGTHYAVNGRLLTWSADAANRPQVEQTYSIAYTARIEWIVFLPPQDRYEAGVNLGQKCLLRARHALRSAD